MNIWHNFVNLEENYEKRIAAILLVLSLALSFAGCEAKTDLPSSSPASDKTASQPKSAAQQPQEPAKTEFKVGETITINDLEITVFDVYTSEGGEFIKPEAGKVYYFMDVAVLNKGKETQNISSMLMFELRSSDGVAVNQSLMAQTSVEKSGVDGAVMPGKVIRGNLGFEVDADPKGYELQINMSVIGDKDIVSVKLDEKADTAAQPPVSAKSGNEAAIGQAIVSGDLEFVINGITTSGGKNLFKPAEGNEFLLVDVTVTNKGSETKSISSLLTFTMRDQQGYAYPISISASSAGKGNVDGEIMAGKALSGELGYEVKPGTSGLELVVNPSVFENDKIFVVTLN